jgi:quercetin dioxygenase-like cupin family protein
MRTRTKLSIGTAAVICTIAGLALATPPGGVLFNNILSLGSVERDVNEHVRVELDAAADAAAGREVAGNQDRDDDWSARVGTRGPSNFIVQDFALLPGGFTGWHSHPGFLLITVMEGSVEWYSSNCALHVYNTGDSLTENTEPHYVRNVGSVNARLMATYVIAKGQPRRIEQPAPACGAALGLN